MPQLMPISWIFSSFMIFMVVISFSMMYSNSVMVSFVKFTDMGISKMKVEMWLW